jgi:hypothetical protein
VLAAPNEPVIGPGSPKRDKERLAPPPAKTKTTPEANKPGPKITFEKVVHDFGEVGPRTRHSCEFKFTNTGDGLLQIGRIKPSCFGCTVTKLSKKEYTPDESGTLKVTYSSSKRSGLERKYVFVYSNDKARPSVTLTVKAKIVPKVSYQPERLNLSLKGGNADCPKITLTSRDNQPFAITQFKSTANSITADFDASVKKTKFVLEAKVDMEKLRRGLNGSISISLTHPECRTVTIPFITRPRFKITPLSIYILNAEPQKPIKRKVWIFNNYGEDFEIESALPQKGIIKVLSQEKVRSGYQFEVEITPPAAEGGKRFFKDVFVVNIKGGEKLQITCRGFYNSRKVPKRR